MARDVSLLQIRTEIVNIGGYKNSPVFTREVLNSWINRSIARVYDLVWDAENDYYTDETDLSTTAGSDSVLLPSDFKKLIGIARQDGGDYRRLHRMRQHEWIRWEGQSGKPTHYRLQRGNLRLAAKPDAVYALRMYYLPVAPTLTLDADTFDSIDYFDELVIADVLLKCGVRDERQTGDLKDNVDRLEKQVRSRADGRDSGEPLYLADLGDDCDDAEFY